MLIDGDVFAYEAATATETTADFDGTKVRVADPERACRYYDDLMLRFLEATGSNKLIVALSCSTRRYFRHDLWPAYKATRVGTPRPEALDTVKTYIEKRYQAYRMPGLEADDVLGILATGSTIKGHKIIVSTDKDMKQIPGDLYNPKVGKVETVTPEAGHWWHMYQTLVGDRCDNYPGCPGVGPVKAKKILSDLSPDAQWGMVLIAFANRGLTEEDALVQARVSRILQVSDWDRKKKKVKLWTPS